jgi:hypothetical protein
MQNQNPSQPTVVYVQQPVMVQTEENTCCAGCLSAFLSCVFCPFCGLSSFCCYSLPKTSPIIILFSGIGGLFSAIRVFWYYGYTQTVLYEYHSYPAKLNSTHWDDSKPNEVERVEVASFYQNPTGLMIYGILSLLCCLVCWK